MFLWSSPIRLSLTYEFNLQLEIYRGPGNIYTPAPNRVAEQGGNWADSILGGPINPSGTSRSLDNEIASYLLDARRGATALRFWQVIIIFVSALIRLSE